MMKAPLLILLFFLFVSRSSFSQCATAPPVPPDCTGTEPLVTDGEELHNSTTKWFYGATTMFSTLSLKGGTLVVCGDLSIDKFYMDSGTIYVLPGARFVITSGIGSGLIFTGGCYIYNYGTCEIQRNLSLVNNASVSNPNLLINATTSSVFKMSNQYLVINNAHSWFVNRGTAEFWGIIHDPLASAGSVCLGNGSSTQMAVLINKVANSYSVPTGNACLYVRQFSQFYGQLTNNTGLLACLGNSHTSDSGCIPWGCQPNNWGSAQVFTSCNSCSALLALSVHFTSFTNSITADYSNQLNWEMNTAVPTGMFRILRSADGSRFSVIDSFEKKESSISKFTRIDKNPLPGNNHYMIKYTNSNGYSINSKIVHTYTEPKNGFSIFPVPFDKKFIVRYAPGMRPEKIIITDISGRNIKIHYNIKESSQQVEIILADKVEAGIYIIHMVNNQKYTAQTIIKN
jgi:hypothetical protein